MPFQFAIHHFELPFGFLGRFDGEAHPSQTAGDLGVLGLEFRDQRQHAWAQLHQAERGLFARFKVLVGQLRDQVLDPRLYLFKRQ